MRPGASPVRGVEELQLGRVKEAGTGGMIDCYFLAVCRASSLDRDTNNFSVTHLIEEVQIPAEALGQIFPFELHFYVQVGEELIGKSAEFRIVWREQGGRETPGANTFTFELPIVRCRTRTSMLKIPESPGYYRILLEWRSHRENAWSRCAAFWPLEVKVMDEGSMSVIPAAPSQPPTTTT